MSCAFAQSIIGRGAALLRERCGATAIEFAFAAPVLLTTVVAIMEFSMAMAASMILEGAVRDAARYGITGYQAEGESRADAILAMVDQRSNGIVRLEELTLSTKVYPSFAGIGEPEPFVDAPAFNHTRDPGEPYTDINGNGQWDEDIGASGAGGPGDIVMYTVRARWPLLTGLLRPLFGGDSLALQASMVVRNEPFDAP